MTFLERYDHLLSLVTELRLLEIKELKLWKAGGRLPVQDRERKSKVQFQIDKIIESQPKVTQKQLF